MSPCGEQAGTVLGSRYTFHWKNSPILNIGSEVLKNCTYIQFPDEHSPSELGCSCRACRGRAPGPAAATGWGRGGPAEGQAGSADLLLWGSLAEGPGWTQGPGPGSGNRRVRHGGHLSVMLGHGQMHPGAADSCTRLHVLYVQHARLPLDAQPRRGPAAGRKGPGANPIFRAAGSQGSGWLLGCVTWSHSCMCGGDWLCTGVSVHHTHVCV